MNALVMNYLVTEGHAAAAETFAAESGTPGAPLCCARLPSGFAPDAPLPHPLAGVELGSIAARMAVRAAVASGDVAGAIERVNDLDPDVLEQRPSLLFALQRQRLIELIRAGDVDAALDFAAEYLAPHAATDAAFLAEVEQALALLVFATPADAPPPLSELLAPAQRATAAGELNAAILNSQGQESGAFACARPNVLSGSDAFPAQSRGCRGCSSSCYTRKHRCARGSRVAAHQCAELCPSPFQLAESTTFPSIVDVSTGVLESAHAAEGLD